MKYLLSFLLLATIFTAGYTNFDNQVNATSGGTKNIVQIASENENLSTLVSALQKANLVSNIQNGQNLTVFAPTNQAFDKLLSQLGITADELLNSPQLADVLTYHVLATKANSQDLQNGMKATTLNGETVSVDLSNGVKINNSNVIQADIEASNGVVHVIDTVLVPSSFSLANANNVNPNTVVDIALGNQDFSILVSALQKADLVSTLKGEGPFTVFAPTNAAFENLAKSLNITPNELLNQPDLAKVLLQHVVSGNITSDKLSNNQTATTLNSESITFDLSDGVKVNSSKVVSADNIADNGVVHVIDTVLVPSNFNLVEVAHDGSIPKTGAVNYTLIAFIALSLAVLGFVVSRKLSYNN